MNMRRWSKTVPVIVMAALILPVAGCFDDDDNGNDIQIFIVPDDFATIQLAINAASDGDEVIVLPGVYPERIDFIGKNITVRSEDPDDHETVADTIINAMGQAPVVRFAGGETEAAVLRGFTLTGADAGGAGGGAIVVDNASHPLIKQNLITANSANQGAGAYVDNGSEPVFEDNIFTGNSAGRRGAGIFAVRGSSVTITNNTFQDNSGGAVQIGSTSILNSSSTALITGNLIDGNIAENATGGIKIIDESYAMIADNIITGNTGRGDHAGAAITVGNESEAQINGNTITGNAAHQRGAIVIHHESDVVISGNTIMNNSAGEPGELFGMGGGISVTRSATAVIADNSITGNTAGNTNQGGGGIRVARGADVEITGNTISGNRAHRHGGGIQLWGADTQALITENTIAANRAEGHFQANGGGIHVHSAAEAVIFGNAINGNLAQWYGGGVYVDTDAAVHGQGNIPWIRMNCPAGIEVHNTYDDNDHGDDQYGGSDVFFREVI